jgi:uncharacterized protein (DUF169 family)
MNYQEASRELKGALRLRTEPLGAAFLAKAAALPEKTRRPSQVLGKRVTICQGVTMARVYGWAVGLTPEDLICVPAMLAFGLAPEPDPGQEMGRIGPRMGRGRMGAHACQPIVSINRHPCPCEAGLTKRSVPALLR